MIKLTAVKDDKLIIVDGRKIKSDEFVFDENVHAVQWDGEKGHIEFNNGSPNQLIESQGEIQVYFDQHSDEVLKIDSKPKLNEWETANYEGFGVWSITIKSKALKLMKDKKTKQVKDKLDSEIAKPYNYEIIQAILKKFDTLGVGFVTLIDKDGSVVDYTKADLELIEDNYINTVLQSSSKFKQKKESFENAKTIEEINEIDLS